MPVEKYIYSLPPIGTKFGLWEVISHPAERAAHRTAITCRCECGNVRTVWLYRLLAGKSKYCSHARHEPRTIHGLSRVKGEDGRSIRGAHTPEFRIWQGMKDRCFRPTANGYGNYGGRGITVCERWMSFANFLADVGPRPSLDHSLERENNDGNYEPGNVKWATRIDQRNNTRTNHFLEYDGRRLTITQWARALDVSAAMIRWRVGHGWAVAEALNNPSGAHLG